MPASPRLFSLLLLGTLSGLVGCDHVTKHLATEHLQNRPAQGLIQNVVELRYVENTDMAFNLLRWIPEATRQPLLLALGISATLSLVVVYFFLGRSSRWLRFTGCLVLAGAIGNVLDRVLRGHVVDFIHVRHWPVFNLADVYIVIGGGLLLLFNRSATKSRVDVG